MMYYDLILGGIGLLMVGGAVATLFVGTAGMYATALLAVALVGHAMFISPPIDYSD